MNRESPSNKKREEMAYVMAVWLLGIFHGFFMVVTLRFRGVLTVEIGVRSLAQEDLEAKLSYTRNFRSGKYCNQYTSDLM